MSDSRKRSRKSKLEVRTEAHFEETEETVLQTFTLPLLRSEKKPIVQYTDHNYSLQQAEPPSSLPRHVSVEVEMEEFDESDIAAENKDINESTDRMLSRFSSNPALLEIEWSTLPVFSINLDKMYKIADHITWSSNNRADKHLGIVLRNIWGRIVYQKHKEDPYDTLIQKALQNWVQASIIGRCTSETPIFYQCHICDLAWWYLHPFREHIKFHDLKKLKVYMRTNRKESVIVANEVVSKIFRYIPCDGDCHRCGRHFASHIRSDEIQYNCFQCGLVLETCSSFKYHQPICYKSLTPTLCRQTIYKCAICNAESLTHVDWETHMRTIHVVRSDEPTLISLKSCCYCSNTYHEIKTHAYICLKSAINGACTYCYKKFPTMALAAFHSHFSDKFVCKICGLLLAKKCMETEHMLLHTDKYIMAYRCVVPDCPPTTLFPDEQTVMRHRWLEHKKTTNSRKNFCEKVLIPEPCAKLNLVEVDVTLESSDVIHKELNSQANVDDQSSRNSQTDKQTDSQMSLEYIQTNEVSKVSSKKVIAKCVRSDKLEDDQKIPLEVSIRNQQIDAGAALELKTIQVKTKPVEEKIIFIQENPIAVIEEQLEIEEVSCYVDDMTATRDVNIELQRDNVTEKPKESELDNRVADNAEDEEMDAYEQMLSKVFRVSEAVRNHKIDSCAAADSETVKVKIEPLDEMLDFEGLIDIQENPIIIKEEVVETEDSFDINDMATTCDVKIEPQDEVVTEESQTTEMYEEHLNTDIKMEPELIDSSDYSIMGTDPIEKPSITDSETSQTTGNEPLITVIKMEPGEVRPELIEATDLQIMESSSLLSISNSQTDVEPDTTDKLIIDTKKKRKPSVKKKHIIDPNELKDVDHLRKRKRKTSSKLYTCTSCGYTNVHFLYRIHVKSNCGQVNRSYKCTKCDSPFNTMKLYLLHFKKHGYDVLTCRYCSERFDDLKELAPHFYKHVRHSYVRFWKIDKRSEVSLKKHRCQTCSEEVAPELFFDHWERHLVLNNGTVKIEPESTTEESDNVPVNKNLLPPKILRDVLKQLLTEARHRECGVCLRKFERRYDTKRHLIEHLLMDAYVRKDRTNSKGLKCQICFKEFVLMAKYKFHMREHGGLPVYKCELCDKTFSDSSNFAKHKKLHSLKVLICDICKKKFHAKIQLEKHLMMHQTTSPIKCRFCVRQFFTQSLYNKHLKSKHERPSHFKCKVCDQFFDCFRDKMDHMWTIHKERKQVADCPYCKQEFRKIIEVKVHVKKVHNVSLNFNTTARRKHRRKRTKNTSQDTFV